ncbi:Amino acid permease [Flavobacterium longum]|uniref:DUF3810 domain-containing protein n=1 Tax=Flavobacterium longum TaxID=1299340 RepID=UPI0039EB975E
MKKKYILPLLLLVQIIGLRVLALFPEFVERFYTNGFYRVISGAERTLLGWIPFSVGDVCYAVLIVLAMRWVWKNRKTFKAQWKDNLLKILSAVSVFYFFFNLFWGLNYLRVKLPEKLDIATKYNNAELLDFTEKLIAKTNAIQLELTKCDTARVVFPYSQQQVFEKNLDGYAALAKTSGSFHYDRPSVKASLFSYPLTYMGFGGYLNPFTNEAHVNDRLPMYGFPMTAAHEMAHQIGYASESEANFVGFLASVKNDDLYFKYAGYTTALKYCLGNWEVRDEKTLKTLLKTINPGVRKNFQDSKLFWESYETFIEEGFKIFYHNFLKLNQQEGLESYSRFVDLLVNYYRNRAL